MYRSYTFRPSFEKEFIIPFLLFLGFLGTVFFYNQAVYFLLIVALVLTVQLSPLSSDMTENIILLCFPIIGLLANYKNICLTYNSTVLFLLTRSFALNGTVRFRYVVVYFLMVASVPFYHENPFVLYGGAIMHGIMHPFNFFLITRKSKLVRLCVFIVPVWWGLDNLYKGLYFTAWWDMEIFLVYFLWALGFDKRQVVQKIFLFSLPIISFAQMFWDVCPR